MHFVGFLVDQLVGLFKACFFRFGNLEDTIAHAVSCVKSNEQIVRGPTQLLSWRQAHNVESDVETSVKVALMLHVDSEHCSPEVEPFPMM